MKSQFSLFLLALGIGLASSASGAVIVANTGAGLNSIGQSNTTHLSAAQFLSPNVATTITSVDLALEQTSGTPNVTLRLFSNVAGLPGVNLASLGSQNVNGNLTYTFTPGAGVGIGASTLYWLVLSCSNCQPAALNWKASNPATVSGMPGADVSIGLASSGNGGATWGIFGPMSLVFQVHGDVSNIPEPGTASLLSVAAGLALLLRRRMR